MEVSVRIHPAGFPVFTVRSGEHEFELSAFGGQLLDWTKAGVPILFANREHAIFDGQTPYRGGAPICFPYFGKGALLPNRTTLSPQHGRSRTSVWDSEVRQEEGVIVFRTEQPSPEGYGPATLSCELRYIIGSDLRIEARVTNRGPAATPFQLAVHSYWACAAPAEAKVDGLGERYLDNLRGLQEHGDGDSSAPHEPPFDRIYPDSAPELELETGPYRLSISTEGGAGTVLWNPGPAHPLGDLGSPDFVCVESGVIIPAVALEPGEEHRLAIEYRVRTSGYGSPAKEPPGPFSSG